MVVPNLERSLGIVAPQWRRVHAAHGFEGCFFEKGGFYAAIFVILRVYLRVRMSWSRAPPGAAPSPHRPCAGNQSPRKFGCPPTSNGGRVKPRKGRSPSPQGRLCGSFPSHVAHTSQVEPQRAPGVDLPKAYPPPGDPDMNRPEQSNDPYAPPPRYKDRSGRVLRIVLLAGLLGLVGWGYMAFNEGPSLSAQVQEEQTLADSSLDVAPAPLSEPADAPLPPQAVEPQNSAPTPPSGR